MNFTEEQELFQKIIQKAWEDVSFKNELIENPVETIEKLIGKKIMLPENKRLVVRDQTDQSKVFINIPSEPKLADLELNEEELEAVAGGTLSIWPIILPKIPIIENGQGGDAAV